MIITIKPIFIFIPVKLVKAVTDIDFSVLNDIFLSLFTNQDISATVEHLHGKSSNANDRFTEVMGVSLILNNEVTCYIIYIY